MATLAQCASSKIKLDVGSSAREGYLCSNRRSEVTKTALQKSPKINRALTRISGGVLYYLGSDIKYLCLFMPVKKYLMH
jgi:hypothetical protein